MDRTTLDGHKIITLKDIETLEKIRNMIIDEINIMDDSKPAEDVFSIFLNFIWIYEPEYKHTTEKLDFLYQKPRALFIEEVFKSYQSFLNQKTLEFKLRFHL